MSVFRPVTRGDVPGLQDLLARSSSRLIGMSSLVPDPELAEARIDASIRAFATDIVEPGEESYLFVLDGGEGRILGMSGVLAAVGLSEPFWSYRVGITVKSSRELGIYKKVPTLYLTNDYTGHAELCSLYLDPESRGRANGRLLSLGRLMFLADFADRFAPVIIAEMRGVLSPTGESPFYQGLGRHFFDLPFGEADDIYGRGNKQFIAELMPGHPVYVNLLPATAQAVIGEVHEQTLPARRMLESEGLRWEGYIDIFDAGPTLAGPVDVLRTVAGSVAAPVRVESVRSEIVTRLVSNARFDDFRCVTDGGAVPDLGADEIIVDSTVAATLGVSDGDVVRAGAIRPPAELVSG